MSVRSLPPGTRAVFFDAVGTVLYPDPAVAAVYAEASARYGLTADPAAITVRFREAFRREEEADRRIGWVTDETREITRWKAIVQTTLPDAPSDCFWDLYAHFARPDAWRVPADVPAVLARLENKGMILGLASNYDQRLMSVLGGRPELEPLADRVLISSQIGVRKPKADFFRILAEVSNCRPDEMVLVGNDLENDYLGATAAGMHAVLLDPSRRHPDVPYRVESLKSLIEPVA